MKRSLSFCGSLPKVVQQPELGQVQVKSLEHHLCIPSGWQYPSFCSQHLLPAQVCLSRKQILETQLLLKLSTKSQDAGVGPSWCPKGARLLSLLIFIFLDNQIYSENNFCYLNFPFNNAANFMAWEIH